VDDGLPRIQEIVVGWTAGGGIRDGDPRIAVVALELRLPESIGLEQRDFAKVGDGDVD
jgi:hypothetical protein